MAITFIGHKSAGSFNATTFPITLPAGWQEGDFILGILPFLTASRTLFLLLAILPGKRWVTTVLQAESKWWSMAGFQLMLLTLLLSWQCVHSLYSLFFLSIVVSIQPTLLLPLILHRTATL